MSGGLLVFDRVNIGPEFVPADTRRRFHGQDTPRRDAS